MSDDVAAMVAFVRACLDAESRRLDEDERVANAAHPGPWHAEPAADSVYADESSTVRMPGPLPRWATYVVPPQTEGRDGIEPADAIHIARWDPARVLELVETGRRDIDAKRAILDEAEQYSPELEHGDNGEWAFGVVVRLLARQFAGKPGWRTEWTA